MAVIEGEDIFVASDDVFRGVAVDPAGLVEGPEAFGARLARSLATWKGREYRLVWLEVPIARRCSTSFAVPAGKAPP